MTDIISIMLGVAALLAAFLSPKFYWIRGRYSSSNKEAPQWAGRLLFGLGGILFIVFGVSRLMRGI